jgi:hypothetical protein
MMSHSLDQYEIQLSRAGESIKNAKKQQLFRELSTDTYPDALNYVSRYYYYLNKI